MVTSDKKSSNTDPRRDVAVWVCAVRSRAACAWPMAYQVFVEISYCGLGRGLFGRCCGGYWHLFVAELAAAALDRRSHAVRQVRG